MQTKFKDNKHKYCYIRKALAMQSEHFYRKNCLFYRHQELLQLIKTQKMDYLIKKLNSFIKIDLRDDIHSFGEFGDVGFLWTSFIYHCGLNNSKFENEGWKVYYLSGDSIDSDIDLIDGINEYREDNDPLKDYWNF